MTLELAKAKQILIEAGGDIDSSSDLQSYIQGSELTLTADGSKIQIKQPNGKTVNLPAATATDAGLITAAGYEKLSDLPTATQLSTSLDGKVDKESGKELVSTSLVTALENVGNLEDALDTKVDKEQGKGLIDPAPIDGRVYGRYNGGWTQVTGGGGSGDVEEAPIDGKQYARKDAGWEEVAGGGYPVKIKNFNVIAFDPELGTLEVDGGALDPIEFEEPLHSTRYEGTLPYVNGDEGYLPILFTRETFNDSQETLGYSNVFRTDAANYSSIPSGAGDFIEQKVFNPSATFVRYLYWDGTVYTIIDDWKPVGVGNISYNDLEDKPTIPTKTSQLTNDSNYVVDPDGNILRKPPVSTNVQGYLNTSSEDKWIDMPPSTSSFIKVDADYPRLVYSLMTPGGGTSLGYQWSFKNSVTMGGDLLLLGSILESSVTYLELARFSDLETKTVLFKEPYNWGPSEKPIATLDPENELFFISPEGLFYSKTGFVDLPSGVLVEDIRGMYCSIQYPQAMLHIFTDNAIYYEKIEDLTSPNWTSDTSNYSLLGPNPHFYDGKLYSDGVYYDCIGTLPDLGSYTEYRSLADKFDPYLGYIVPLVKVFGDSGYRSGEEGRNPVPYYSNNSTTGVYFGVLQNGSRYFITVNGSHKVISPVIGTLYSKFIEKFKDHYISEVSGSGPRAFKI